MVRDRLNHWLTLGANIGVLAGIIFLALEIQQNTAATHSSTVQSITDNSTAGLRVASDAARGDLTVPDDDPIVIVDIAEPASTCVCSVMAISSENRRGPNCHT